jgi:hypothetical protein
MVVCLWIRISFLQPSPQVSGPRFTTQPKLCSDKYEPGTMPPYATYDRISILKRPQLPFLSSVVIYYDSVVARREFSELPGIGGWWVDR